MENRAFVAVCDLFGFGEQIGKFFAPVVNLVGKSGSLFKKFTFGFMLPPATAFALAALASVFW